MVRRVAQLVSPHEGETYESEMPCLILVFALTAITVFNREHLQVRTQAAIQTAGRGAHRLRAVAQDNNQQRALAEITITVLGNTPPMVSLLK